VSAVALALPFSNDASQGQVRWWQRGCGRARAMALMLVGRRAPAGPGGGADHRCGDHPGHA
jgi:hypothetical protein